jgi:hypothetical protein
MSDFSALKRNRNAFDSLKKAMEVPSSTAEAGSKDDTRFWQPEVDKAGNGMAIIRFLPAPAADGDDALPWVRVFNHGFQGPGGWYIENSLTTLNQKDPVSEYNSILWNSGIEANKEIARKQKRRLTYISNILVVSDPKHPENEGQIKLYKYGKKIFDKISEAMNPEFADETPLNPFDFWEGANFKIKIRQVEGYRNYDKSEFDSITPVLDGDDDKLEALWKKEYSLKEFLEPKQFKSYDTLKAKLDKVLGLDGVAPVKTKAEDTILTPAKSAPSLNENDEELDYFRSLAED